MREYETSVHGPGVLVRLKALLPAGIGAMTWSPLACGILSGKYAAGIPPCSRASLKVTLAPPLRGGGAA